MDDLDADLTDLEDQRAFHEYLLREINADIKAVLRTGAVRQRRQSGITARGYGFHAHIAPEDLAHFRSIRDAYVEIARQSRGFVRYQDAAKLIMASQLSSSKRSNTFARDLRRWLAGDSDFEHYAPGLYRYLPIPESQPVRTLPGEKLRHVPASTSHVRPSLRWGGGGGDPN